VERAAIATGAHALDDEAGREFEILDGRDDGRRER